MVKIIEAVNLEKVYGNGDEKVNAVRNATLCVNKGEFISITGPSGSGKSTLLYLLSGMDTPTSGKVFLFDRNIQEMKEKEEAMLRREKIGFVFQFFNLVAEMTVEDNVLLPSLIGKKKIDRQELENVLNKVGLSIHAKKFPHELSGGQQQRVAIARALYAKPEIIFADEPTGNLDSKIGLEIMELLKAINENEKATIILVTHSKECAEYASKRIRILDGEIS